MMMPLAHRLLAASQMQSALEGKSPMNTWSVGNVQVTRIEELLGSASLPPEQYLDGFDRDVLKQHLDWLVPDHFSLSHDRMITSVHSWLIRTERQTILLDCCAGNHKDRPGFGRFHQLNTSYLQRLGRAGVTLEEIDIVLCTHLHSDHVGWNTVLQDGRWVPTFPRARYLFSRIENEWGDPRRNPLAQADPQRNNAYRDSVLPVIEAGQAELVDGLYEVDNGMLIEPTPGHTRGHVVLKIDILDGRAVFSGDVIHHPLQVYEPSWNSGFCELPDDARATRRRILEHCAEHEALLFPGHFGAPHVASVVRRGGSFALNFVEGRRA
jgi:glyoxylase-like metal-dependent hydrolase (beta-lactamase superfamily II)